MSILESGASIYRDSRGDTRERNIGRAFKKEAVFPTDVAGRMEALLSSFNATPKATVQMLLNRSMTEKASLANIFKNAITGSGMENVNPEVAIYSYCYVTLCSAGLAKAEIEVDNLGKEKIIGYSITQAGSRYGQPIGAFFVDFEKINGFSLYPIFGATNLARGEHRAPFSRAAIIKALGEGGKRKIDLVQDLRMKPSAVKASLESLEQAGIIEYSSIKPQTGNEQVNFTLGRNPIFEAKTVNKEKVLTEEIAKAISVLVNKGIFITQGNVYRVLPSKFRENLSRKAVAQRISTILSGLGKDGYLLRGKYETHKAFSDAKLTKKGELMLNEFVIPLENACADRATLERLREEVMPRVISHLNEYAKNSANLYYPFSMSFKFKNVEKRNEMIIGISDDGEGRTARDFAEELDEKIPTINLALRKLVKANSLTRVKDNGVYYYSAKRNMGTVS